MTVYLVFYLSFCLFNANFETLENISLFAIAVALVLHANRSLCARALDHSAEESLLATAQSAGSASQ